MFSNRVGSNHGGRSGGQGRVGMERGQVLEILDKGGWEKFTGEIVLLGFFFKSGTKDSMLVAVELILSSY